MKSSKKLFCILLVLVMLLTLVACGNNDSANTTEPAVTEPSSTPTAAVTDSAVSEQPEESIAKYDYTLPLTTDDLTFTATAPYNPGAAHYYNDVNENLTWIEIQERTGVNIEFNSIAGNVLRDHYGVVIASGDMPDAMCNLTINYNGGTVAAYEDGYIVDLMDYIEEYIPNYWWYLNEEEGALKDVKTDNGELLIMPNFYYGGDPGTNGVVFRTDWLENLNLTVPETYDEYYDVLKAIYTEYGGSMWLMACGDSRYGEFSAGYGVSGFFTTVPSLNYPLIVKDGVVRWGTAMDEYQGYLAMLNKWYDEGLLLSDFYSLSGWTIYDEDLAKGGVSAYTSFFTNMDSQTKILNDEGTSLTAAKFPVLNKGDVRHITGDSHKSVRLNTTWAFSTSTENLPLLLQVFDYRFSDEGSFLLNYGVEGITFDYDSAGNPQFTDLIVNNPEGMTVYVAQAKYLSDLHAYPTDGKAFDSIYSDWALGVRDGLWSEDCDNEWGVPSTISLTVDESAEIAGLVGDLMTYMQENVVKFITGALSAENDFNDFAAEQKKLGVDRIEEIYQAAYERYLSR